MDCNNNIITNNGIIVIVFSSLSLQRYGDGAGNTVEENSSVFSLILMR